MTPAFQGEVQLLRWSETSNQGATITLQLADPSDLERFKTMTLAKKGMVGQRLAAVMVEIGEDEQPVQQPEPKGKPGDLCVMACTFCADPVFQAWLDVGDALTAKALVLNACGIDSRRKLDIDADAAHAFHEKIRKPFLAWKAGQ